MCLAEMLSMYKVQRWVQVFTVNMSSTGTAAERTPVATCKETHQSEEAYTRCIHSYTHL